MTNLGKLKTYTAQQLDKSLVSIGFECLDRDLFKPELCYELLAQSGVKHARVQTGWLKCERERGVYDFTWLDGIVDNLIKRGIKPWFNVGFGNPIYMEDISNPAAVGCVPIAYGDEVYGAWKSFLGALAEHYRGRVEYYEIWNEPDIKSFWYPDKPDGAVYAKLVHDSSSVIKAKNPDAKVGAVVAYLSNYAWLAPLLDNLSVGDIDFFCTHIYDPVQEWRYPAKVAMVRKMLDDRAMSEVVMWQGEGGHASWAYEGHPYFPNGADSERAQAVWQLRRYFSDLAMNMERSSFFQIADMWERQYETASAVIRKPAAHGILNGLTYTPKKSYETISYLSSILSGDIRPEHFYAEIESKELTACELVAAQLVTLSKNGYRGCAYYLPTHVDNETCPERSVYLTFGEAFEEPVLVDMYEGSVFEVNPPKPNSRGGFTYSGMPLTDYPMLIIEKRAIEIINLQED